MSLWVLILTQIGFCHTTSKADVYLDSLIESHVSRCLNKTVIQHTACSVYSLILLDCQGGHLDASLYQPCLASSRRIVLVKPEWQKWGLFQD